MEVNGETSTSLASGGAARRSAGGRVFLEEEDFSSPPGCRRRRLRARATETDSSPGGGEPSRRRTNSVSRPADRAEEWVPRRKHLLEWNSEYHSDENPAGARDDTRRDAVRLDRARLDRKTLNPKLRFTLVLVVAVARHVAQRVVRRGDASPLGAPRASLDAPRRPFPSPVVPIRAFASPRGVRDGVRDTSCGGDGLLLEPRAGLLRCFRAFSRGGGGFRGFGVSSRGRTSRTRPRPRPRPRPRRPRRGRRRRRDARGEGNRPHRPRTRRSGASRSAPRRVRRAPSDRGGARWRETRILSWRARGRRRATGSGDPWVGASRTPRWCEVRGESQSAGEPTATRRAAVRARVRACRRCRC